LKLLFDQNLSRKLVTRLADIFPDSSHIQLHDLQEKTDTEIWELARNHDFCIVTQDADFAERSRLYGWLTTESGLAALRECTNQPSRISNSIWGASNSRTLE